MGSTRSHGRVEVDGERGRSGVDCAAVPRRPSQLLGRRRGVSSLRAKRAERDVASSSSRQRPQQRGVRLRSRSRGLWASPGGRSNDCLQDLGLPLGMSFAAVVAQVLYGKNISGDKMHIDHVSMIYGNKFDYFIRNFDKSFRSTLKTLRLIHEVSINKQQGTSFSSFECNCSETAPDVVGPKPIGTIEDFQENMPLNSANNELILREHTSQYLADIYCSTSGHGISQSVLSTMEKSVIEQTRSNDLKAVEIGIVMKKLHLKQSQLALSFLAKFLREDKDFNGYLKGFLQRREIEESNAGYKVCATPEKMHGSPSHR